MKKIKLFIGLAIVLSLITYNVKAGKEKFVKKINNEYAINKDALLSVSNKYGDINCINWDKNVIAIDVTITVVARNKEKADDIFDRINIKISGSKSKVEAVTEISNSSCSWDNGKFTIDYDIKMPKTVNLDILNKYGCIFIEEVTGETDITIKYGDLQVEKLLNENNNITVKYSNASFDFLEAGKLEIKYSDLEIDHSNKLNIETRFSDVKIDNTGYISFDSGYDDVEIDKVSEIYNESKFSSFEINRLIKNLDFNIEYGGCTVDNVLAGFNEIKIISKYANVELDINSEASYYLEADVKYGNLDYPESNSNVTKNKISHVANKYEGTVGSNKNPKSKVIVNCTHGNVSLDD